MKKKYLGTVFVRLMLGIPVGISIGFLITLAISWSMGDKFVPCVPSLIDQLGGELKAVTVQTALCALLGGAFAGASIIWEIDRWSIARQTGAYFIVTALAMLPIAWLTHWMEHTLFGFLSYTAIFVVCFAVIWLAQYLGIRAKIKRMNKAVDENKGE